MTTYLNADKVEVTVNGKVIPVENWAECCVHQVDIDRALQGFEFRFYCAGLIVIKAKTDKPAQADEPVVIMFTMMRSQLEEAFANTRFLRNYTGMLGAPATRLHNSVDSLVITAEKAFAMGPPKMQLLEYHEFAPTALEVTQRHKASGSVANHAGDAAQRAVLKKNGLSW